MLTRLLFLCFAFSASFVVAQTQGDAQLRICSPKKCFLSLDNLNISIGLTFLKNNNGNHSIQLLPGDYSSSIVEKLGMQDFLTSSTIIIPSPGFDLNSPVPPFNITPQPGFVIYPDQFYSGEANSIVLENTFLNQTIPLSGSSSIAIAENSWVAVTAESGYPIILYDTAPLFSFPSMNQITVIDYQSTTCRPPCSGSGACIASGKCDCHEGFAGSSCESCSPGLFGPACKVCPSPCKGCDKKTGLCSTPKTPKTPKVKRAENTCKCENGRCSSDGNCSCLPGYTNATELNGVKCALCAKGFFMASTGDCKICDLGCSKCEDGTGNCKSCQKGFVHDLDDKPKCRALPTVTKNSTCPSNSYSTGEVCVLCTSESCETCKGPSSSDCITCSSGYSKFKNKCVVVDSNGVCEGTNGMIANNDKKMCDTCGPKCKACKIPNFDSGSTIDQVQCTECLIGSAPSKGKCDTVSCPSGQFISRSSCEPCSSNCKTCIDTADKCLTCPTGQFLSGSVCKPCSSACKTCSDTADHCITCSYRLASGECVSACPDGTFNVSHSCVTCHGDCATCYGPSFKQCTSCHQHRPVFLHGRCLRTCASETQVFDPSTSSCLTCHSSCSSCFASTSSNCLACSDPNGVLNADGTCSTNTDGYLGMHFPTG